MTTRQPPKTTKLLKDGNAYFTVVWSPLVAADIYEIGSKVPSLPGVCQLFYKDKPGHLHLFNLRLCWYGGLRSTLREHVDPVWEKDPALRTILEQHPIFYRYSVIDSYPDLQDVYFFLMSAGFKKNIESSKRYKMIYLREQISQSDESAAGRS